MLSALPRLQCSHLMLRVAIQIPCAEPPHFQMCLGIEALKRKKSDPHCLQVPHVLARVTLAQILLRSKFALCSDLAAASTKVIL